MTYSTWYQGAPIPDLPLLRKAVEWAETEATKPDGESQWYQDTWRTTHGDTSEGFCGTSFCIAGYVAETTEGNWVGQSERLYAKDYDHPECVKVNPARNTVHVSDRAQRLLGLTHGEAAQLFSAYNTIDDVRRAAKRIALRAGEVW